MADKKVDLSNLSKQPNVITERRGRGRPKGSKNKVRPVSFVVNVPKTSPKEVVFMLKTKAGLMPVQASEIDGLSKDIQEIQNKMRHLIKS